MVAASTGDNSGGGGGEEEDNSSNSNNHNHNHNSGKCSSLLVRQQLKGRALHLRQRLRLQTSGKMGAAPEAAPREEQHKQQHQPVPVSGQLGDWATSCRLAGATSHQQQKSLAQDDHKPREAQAESQVQGMGLRRRTKRSVKTAATKHNTTKKLFKSTKCHQSIRRFNMWPSWRQLILIGFAILATTSLLCHLSASSIQADGDPVSSFGVEASEISTTYQHQQQLANSNSSGQINTNLVATTTLPPKITPTPSGSSTSSTTSTSTTSTTTSTTTTHRPPQSPKEPIAASSNVQQSIYPKESGNKIAFARQQQQQQQQSQQLVPVKEARNKLAPTGRLLLHNNLINNNNEPQAAGNKWSLLATSPKSSASSNSIRRQQQQQQQQQSVRESTSGASSFDYELSASDNGHNNGHTNLTGAEKPIEVPLAAIVVGRKLPGRNYYESDAPTASSSPPSSLSLTNKPASGGGGAQVATQLGGWTIIKSTPTTSANASDHLNASRPASLLALQSLPPVATTSTSTTTTTTMAPQLTMEMANELPVGAQVGGNQDAEQQTASDLLAPMNGDYVAAANGRPSAYNGPNARRPQYRPRYPSLITQSSDAPTSGSIDRQMIGGLESVVREALLDLMSGAASSVPEPSELALLANAPPAIGQQQQQPVARSHHLPALRAPLPLAIAALPIAGFPTAINPHYLQAHMLHRKREQQQQQQKNSANLMGTASASAPSVSLPPISHLLSPRNPFRLFASSSTPMGSRYRPFGSSGSSGGAGSTGGQGNKLKANQKVGRWFVNPFAGSGGSGNSNHHHHHNNQQQQQQASASNQVIANSQQRPNPFQGSANLIGLDEISNLVGGSGGSSSPNLYAHSHSAEQLERLIRAASQANGIKSTAILPAIVSGPSGAFPGFYIPAIESESESQISELRHGEPSAGGKIPGTDYVLHPEEIRAMMSIGELAWRKQQTSSMASSSNVQASTSGGWRVNMAGEPLANQQPGNYMQENHAANIRDYAYVLPNEQQASGGGGGGASVVNPNPNQLQRDHLMSSQSSPPASNKMQASNSSRELESQLARHFNQNRVHSFPAIIRVNDQDYIHWPLIRVGQNGNRPQGSAAQRQPVSAGSQPMTAQASNNEIDQNNNNNNKNNNIINQSNNPAVRLATQLSPHEIRQVEDSVLETLIMAKALQQQQRMATLANQQAPVFLRPPLLMAPPGNWMHHQFNQPAMATAASQNGQQNSRFRSNFFNFRRRKRRNSSQQQQAGNNQHQRDSLLLSPSSSLIDVTPISLTSNVSSGGGGGDLGQSDSTLMLAPLAHYTNDLNNHLLHQAQEVNEQQQHRNERSHHYELMTSPQWPPVLLADQETNKPRRLTGGSSSAASMEPQLAAESTAPRATLLSPHDATASADFDSDPLDDSSFGSRVTALAATTSNRKANTSGLHATQESSRPKVGATASRQQVTFIPLQRARISLPPELRTKLARDQITQSGSQVANYQQMGGQQPVRSQQAATNQLPNGRINVDWPAMVSDADYFPASQPAQATKPEKSGSQLSARIQPAKHQVNSESLRSESSTNRNFITSQLKLQFTKDYQAREGVPIYNNNVRVAGALDRLRALEGSPQLLTSSTVNEPLASSSSSLTSSATSQAKQPASASSPSRQPKRRT